jgi:hypothetical protein
VGAVVNHKPLRLLLAALVAGALLAAGCGSDEERTSGEEGLFIDAGEATYQVQLSRLLNPGNRPDDVYARGQRPLRPGEQFLAVFMLVENKGDVPYRPPRDMTVSDTQGNEYLPLDTSEAAGFGLDFREPILPGKVAPPPDSPAALGPNEAAMVLYRVAEVSVNDNLPLELEIPVRGGDSSTIGLDI